VTPKPISLSDLPDKFKERNRGILEREGLASGVGMPMDPTKATKQDIRNEKDLQKVCEQWLTSHDYCRLTASEAMRIDEIVNIKLKETPGIKGFFGHWVNNERNPLMSDLAIFSYPDPRPPLLVELKVNDIWQPGQREMVRLGFWHVCWTPEEFIVLHRKWESV